MLSCQYIGSITAELSRKIKLLCFYDQHHMLTILFGCDLCLARHQNDIDRTSTV